MMLLGGISQALTFLNDSTDTLNVLVVRISSIDSAFLFGCIFNTHLLWGLHA